MTYTNTEDIETSRLGVSTRERSVTCWDVVYIREGERRTALVSAEDQNGIHQALREHNGLEIKIETATINPLFRTTKGKILHDNPYESE